MSNTNKMIFITTGGTGGHIFPAQATAIALLKDKKKVMLFTDERYFQYVKDVDQSEYPIHIIASATFVDSSFLGRIKRLFSIGLGIIQSLYHCIKNRPALIISFGGYPALPMSIAAILYRAPLVVVEQNAVMGRTNKLLIPYTKMIATNFPHTQLIPGHYKDKIRLVGNPVRKQFIKIRDSGNVMPSINTDNKFRILVIGGSQGASFLSNLVPSAIERLPKNLQKRLIITQQCRNTDINAVEAQYSSMHCQHMLKTFFDDIADKMANAHIIICRAGASTIAELVTLSKPAILVPFPHAIGNHQLINAEAFVGLGGGWLIEQNDQSIDQLHKILLNIMSDSTIISEYHKNLVKYPYKDAVKTFIKHINGIL